MGRAGATSRTSSRIFRLRSALVRCTWLANTGPAMLQNGRAEERAGVDAASLQEVLETPKRQFLSGFLAIEETMTPTSPKWRPDVTKLGRIIIGKFRLPSPFIADCQRCRSSGNLDKQLGRNSVIVWIDTLYKFAGAFIANP